MKRIAIYGKGGIGKSTISSNLTAALSEKEIKVLQIGCDPKHDSTRLLEGGVDSHTVLDYLKNSVPGDRKLGDIIGQGYKGCLCVEAGGPEPGIGCAGRGIISAFDLLHELGLDSIDLDVIIYDVLGDVVCGGFAVPLRNDYADTVYVVTSGEFMSIYAANNILRGTANYNPNRIGGIIFNSRGEDEELERVKRFSDAVGIPIIAKFSRSRTFMEAEQIGKTVVEAFPKSELHKAFSELSDHVMNGKKYTARYLNEQELEKVVLGKTTTTKKLIKTDIGKTVTPVPKQPYTSRNVERKEELHGCAFAGAATVTDSVTGLTTVLHSPRNCAQFAFQMSSNAVRRSYIMKDKPIKGFLEPDIECTDMSESTMIFGGNSKLEETFDRLIKTGKNNFALITSCTSGIIGDDAEGISRNTESKYPGVKILNLIEDGNVKGDFMQGVIDASIGLMRSYSIKDLPKTRSVNIVGIKTISTNCISNNSKTEKLLDMIGIRINCNCIGNTDIESIKSMTAADLNILISPDRFALMLQDFMQNEYQMDFTKNVVRPGLKGTEMWLMEIAEYFGVRERAEQTMTEIKNAYSDRLALMKDDLIGQSVYIMSLHKDIDWILETIKMAGMNIKRVVVLDRSDYFNDYNTINDYPEIEFVKDFNIPEMLKDIEEKEPDLLLTQSHVELKKNIRQSYIPLVPDIGPYTGLDFAESWIRADKAPKREEWRNDVI